MKYIIPLLIFINLPLLAQQYYYSNSLAMELSEIHEIDKIEIGESEWILIKTESGNSSERVLYNFGNEKKRMVHTTLQYSEFIDGFLREEIFYRNDGQIAEIMSFDNRGESIGKESYQYSPDGKLLSIRISGSEDENPAVRNYILRGDGSLRLVSLIDESEDEPHHRESWNSYKGNFFMEERLYNSSREVVLFNENNSIRSIFQYAGELLVYKEVRSYYFDGSVKTIEKIFPETDKKYIQTIDDAGFMINEEYYIGSRLSYSLSNRYVDSTLVQTDKVGSGIEEKWIYFYRDDENIGEDYYKQGMLEQKKTITDGDSNSYKVELYNDGVLFMNLIYSEDVKIREEFISNGEIVRIRELGD